MKLDIFDGDEMCAKRSAEFIAEQARTAVTARGKFTFAVSGGRTPWKMLGYLADADVPWSHCELFQVDERIAPDGDADRNMTRLQETLLSKVPLGASHVHAMPVDSSDPERAAADYAATLRQVTGSPAVLDLAHLGLGPDGHTASLIPGDPVLDEQTRDVALAGPYQGRLRMTMTYPVLDRARCLLWVVTGDSKAEMLRRLLAADPSIPSGRVGQSQGVVFADQAAARGLPR